jgi:biopolymer transport protein ExbB/TolQ
MWILLIIAVVILVLSIRKLTQLFGSAEVEPLQFESGLNAILFWSGISLLIGLFAHFHGIYMAMQAISRASDISPAIVAMGYSMSLITVLSGMFIFIVSLIIWFFLRWRFNKIRQATTA